MDVYLAPEQLQEIVDAIHSVGYAISIFSVFIILMFSAFVFWFIVLRE